MQQTNNQHTTPKCYLKNFSKDGKTVFRKHKRADSSDLRNKELNKPISLKSATVKDNFYTVKSGNDPMLVETAFYSKVIENYYNKYYNLLINSDSETILSMEDRSRLLMCLLSLHCRTPKQFNYFFDTVPEQFNHEIDKIKEDYKAAHIEKTLTSFIQAHEFKVFKIAKITDTSEFITSDNPILILNQNGALVNHMFSEQFNKTNKIIIPLDPKHCCILTNILDKNGTNLEGKVYYNKIDRTEVDCSFVQHINDFMIQSADLYYFGSEKYMNAFFGLYKLTE